MAASPGVILIEAVQNAAKHKPKTAQPAGVLVTESVVNAATNSNY